MKKLSLCVIVLLFGVALSTACTKPGTHSSLKLTSPARQEKTPDAVLFGKASWYGHPFHGRTTANGERYNMYALTAAHKTLPLGSILKVTNTINNKTVMVRVNDRGPYIPGRILDLSLAAAAELDMVNQGVGNVKIEVYKPKPKLVARR